MLLLYNLGLEPHSPPKGSGAQGKLSSPLSLSEGSDLELNHPPPFQMSEGEASHGRRCSGTHPLLFHFFPLLASVLKICADNKVNFIVKFMQTLLTSSWRPAQIA